MPESASQSRSVKRPDTIDLHARAVDESSVRCDLVLTENISLVLCRGVWGKLKPTTRKPKCLTMIYPRKKSLSACLITSRPVSEMALVRGMSLGQTSTQFCAKPHSWMPPSPISACSRSCFKALPVGC
jgi:hypothetical protein